MFKTAATFALAAIFGAGLLASEAKAVTAGDQVTGSACAFGGDYAPGFPPTVLLPNGGVSTTTDCSGIYKADSGVMLIAGAVKTLNDISSTKTAQQIFNETEVNELAFDGSTNWKLVEEVSGGDVYSNDNYFQLKILRPDSTEIVGGYPANGRWSVDSLAPATKAAIMLINEDNLWAIYLLDMSLTSGAWSFEEGFKNAAGKSTVLKSFQLYVVADVPVPAALPLMLTGIAGLVMLKRRKRAA